MYSIENYTPTPQQQGAKSKAARKCSSQSLNLLAQTHITKEYFLSRVNQMEEDSCLGHVCRMNPQAFSKQGSDSCGRMLQLEITSFATGGLGRGELQLHLGHKDCR